MQTWGAALIRKGKIRGAEKPLKRSWLAVASGGVAERGSSSMCRSDKGKDRRGNKESGGALLRGEFVVGLCDGGVGVKRAKNGRTV